MDDHADHDGRGDHGGGGGDRLVFRNYAKAHRHGHVVGQLPGGHAIPFGPYTLTQVGVFVTALVGLYLARGLWMHFGRVVNLLVLIGLPYTLAVAERFVRPEGRSPLRSVVSLAGYATFRRGGRVRGRPLPTRTRRLPRRPARIVVRDFPDAAAVAMPVAPSAGADGTVRHRRAADQGGLRRHRRVAGPARRSHPVPAASAGSSGPAAGWARRVPSAAAVPDVLRTPIVLDATAVSDVPPGFEVAPAGLDRRVRSASAVPAAPGVPTAPGASAVPDSPAGPVTLADLLDPLTAPAGRGSAVGGEGR